MLRRIREEPLCQAEVYRRMRVYRPASRMDALAVARKGGCVFVGGEACVLSSVLTAHECSRPEQLRLMR